jgi:hypothetical protein
MLHSFCGAEYLFGDFVGDHRLYVSYRMSALISEREEQDTDLHLVHIGAETPQSDLFYLSLVYQMRIRVIPLLR